MAKALRAYKAYRDVTRPGTPGLGARLRAIPRMLKAATSGRYPGLGKRRLAMLAVGVVYLVSPIDLVPEAALLAFGVVDDFGMFMWMMSTLLGQGGEFVEWEKQQLRSTHS
ncbi:YkvA family protein [Nonomuraea sp. NPDC050663]|uniref:YkvA family protein n=1 Tax=Nonomuraea sp. NPDC050663 TaxID=3364370 RepID=UPI001845B450|nr:DUF1232 domain-containing protein [Thermoactinospora sp.]